MLSNRLKELQIKIATPLENKGMWLMSFEFNEFNYPDFKILYIIIGCSIYNNHLYTSLPLLY